MARSHKGHTYPSNPGIGRGCLGRSGFCSARLAHLLPMESTSTTASNLTVVHGAFEQAWSLKDLAGRLHVSCQTIYGLRSQARGPKGFRIGPGAQVPGQRGRGMARTPRSRRRRTTLLR